MSLAETQQIMSMLQEIMQMMNGIDVKTKQVVAETPKVQAHELSLQKQVRTLNIMMMVVENMTGDKNIDALINKVQQFIMLLMRLRMVMLAVEAASGPWGWVYAGANIAAFGVTSLNTLGQS